MYEKKKKVILQKERVNPFGNARPREVNLEKRFSEQKIDINPGKETNTPKKTPLKLTQFIDEQ